MCRLARLSQRRELEVSVCVRVCLLSDFGNCVFISQYGIEELVWQPFVST